jgi:hypothetical protein
MKTGKIVKKIGVISRGKRDSKEINIVEWTEGYKVIDIRKWSDEEAYKGISLNLKEAESLQIYLDEAIKVMKSMVGNKVETMDVNKLGFDPIRDSDVEG